MITEVFKSGADPIHGTATAKIWIDDGVKADGNGTPYVQRHYEISPASKDTAATGTVILYFKQAEFSNYNAYAKVANGTYPMLPTDSNDAAGFKNNLRINKINGISGDGSGNLNTYKGIATFITPSFVTYLNGRWQATFNVTGFGGFFAVTTSATLLPVSWLSVAGALNNQNHSRITWKVQEQNVMNYSVEKSNDGSNFSSMITIASKGNGINNYQFTEIKTLSGAAFYRIKQTDKDGKFNYSIIVFLSNTSNPPALSLFPNPVNDYLFISGFQNNKTYHVIVTDMFGRNVLGKEITSSQNRIFINSLSKGGYLIKIMTDANTTTLKFVKK